MKRSVLLVLSSLLLTSASYAGNTKCEECYDFSTKNAAALHYTLSKSDSPESKYWDDYIHSGTKDITVYVRDLSRKDAQAALWFITTGGKHGFAAREATAQERVLLEDAIKQVALSYSQQGVKSGRGLQEWSKVSNANHAGHLHLQMIYKKIDDLKSEVNNLNLRVNLLEKAQEESNKKYDKIYEELKAESQERTTSLPLLLQAQTEGIKAIFENSEKKWETMMAKWDTNIEKDRVERERLRLEAVADKSNYKDKLAAQKLADKTAADALLETEKAKIQAEVGRQKDKKKTLKTQVAEYKVKEAAAEKAKAVADALKEQQEAAAKALKETQEAAAETLRREKEAAAERERDVVKRLEATQRALLFLGRAHTGQQNVNLDQILASLNLNG